MKEFLIVTIIFSIILVIMKNIELKNREIITLKDILLDIEALQKHAVDIARNHSVSKEAKFSRTLIYRLDNNFKCIENTYKILNKKRKEDWSYEPAIDWLLDNFFLVEIQYRSIRQDLKRDRYSKLQILSNGKLKGYPRAYAIALELVSHTDGNLDEEHFTNFIDAYQTQTILSTNEIWYLSIMLRIALIEYIRVVSEKILNNILALEKIEKLDLNEGIEDLLNAIQKGVGSLDKNMKIYASQLIKKLKKSENTKINVLDEILTIYGTNVDKIVEQEHQEQLNRRIAIGNAIMSLKKIATIDWNDLFESLSITEKILRKDPSNIYSKMDYKSREYYRRIVNGYAHKFHVHETYVANKAIELSRACYDNGFEDRKCHVGYYIVGKGKLELLNSLPIKRKITKVGYNLSSYLLPIFLLTALLSLVFAFYSYKKSLNIFISIVVFITALIPMSDISISLINWCFIRKVSPAFLPRLKFSNKIPEEMSTLVVITTLLSNEKQVIELIKKLEIYYLGNKEENIYYGIVGDFKDSFSSNSDDDERIINRVVSEIDRLNKKYHTDVFHLFIRHRKYNKTQNKWMGWERKRGAIVELNKLLLGSEKTSFSIISENVSNIINKIRYVITLDADTFLPMGAAKKLIGTISHPINKAVFDEDKKIVIEGYGLIQPRIAVDIESFSKSVFSKIFAGECGIDIYTTAVSDVYQDVFGEGIFTGKGIYDIDIFERSLSDAIPENSVLSHDLLEGSYVRTGLVTDIELIDGYPWKYSSFVMRLHRWTRGDWQLIPWLKKYVLNRKCKKEINPISSLSKWKILDNLRRSLLLPSLLLVFALGLTIFPGNFIVWLGLVFLVLDFPVVLRSIEYLFGRKHIGKRYRTNLKVYSSVERILLQGVLLFVFLPYQSYMMIDAIFRTLYRLLISRKNLLEWTTAADAEKNLKNDYLSYVKRMKVSIVFSLLMIILSFFKGKIYPIYSISIGVIWMISPFIAYKVSVEQTKNKLDISNQDLRLLRRIARKTWRYFEDFADKDNNYLPPDNYQLNPYNGVAYRTSPTNIGFLLISILSARDLGYITTTEMVNRIDKTIATLEKMEKWEGHFYNWYNTKNLKPLMPFFISSVDSGNLIGYMMTVMQGIREYLNKPLIDSIFVQEINETYKEFSDSSGFSDQSLKISYNSSLWELKKWIDDTIKMISDESINENNCYRILRMIKKELDFLLPNKEVIDYDKNVKLKQISNIVKESLHSIDKNTSLLDLRDIYDNLVKQLEDNLRYENIDEKNTLNIENLRKHIKEKKDNADEVIKNIDNIYKRLEKIVNETRFDKLYDSKVNLISIGYNVREKKLIDSYYDLLASEARIVSYIGIIKGEIPKSHWFKLGRSLTEIDKYRGLVSWTGTMFEYLMPNLILKSYDYTLLDETYRTAIRAQKRYGQNQSIPWGISESGYFSFDMQLNYQYKAFGIPKLGLKRGLSDDIVVSPYSTFLALNFDYDDAMKNIREFIDKKMEGIYGFYEAIDFTKKRLPYGSNYEIIRSYMTHHQGMSLVSINNILNDNIMQKRFHSFPHVNMGEILLKERMPNNIVVSSKNYYLNQTQETAKENVMIERVYGLEDIKDIECQMISSGRYSLMITNRGGGFSKKGDILVNRWRRDNLLGKYGNYIFLRDLKENKVWCSTFEPLNILPEKYDVSFTNDKAKFSRKDGDIETQTEVIVSSEENAEIRKVRISNHGDEVAMIEVTSYMELTMTRLESDLAHPAFSNLFVRTEYIPKYDSILAHRRPRGEDEEYIWAVHSVVTNGNMVGSVEYETSREKFIGRGRDVSNPKALNRPLTKTEGVVLDPVMSLRVKIIIKPRDTSEVIFITGIGEDKKESLSIAQKYKDMNMVERAFELSYNRSFVEASYLNLKGSEIKLYQNMIPHLLFLTPIRRKYDKYLKNNCKGQSGLWAYGISGDNPIVLVSIKEENGIGSIKQVLKAHEYWAIKGLKVDLVILNEDRGDYLQSLYQSIKDIVNSSNSKGRLDSPGGIFIRKASEIPEEDRILLYASARIILKCGKKPIASQINYKSNSQTYMPFKNYIGKKIKYVNKDETLELMHFNDYGGFANDGKEYIIKLTKDINTPRPWINVISNNNFGFVVTESGGGFTWSENSRENKITPWSNDPISDMPGEIIYTKDEETGEIWTVTPLPIREKESYIITHGIGYSTISHNSHGIQQSLTVFVPVDEPIKLNVLKIKNISSIKRKLSFTYYIRPVLGVDENKNQFFIKTELDDKTGAILVRNPYNTDFPNRLTFVDTSEIGRNFTCDRVEFLGQLGSLREPEGLKREGLSGTVGCGFDPCVALQVTLEIGVNEEKEVIFSLGQEKAIDSCRSLIEKYKDVTNVKIALIRVKEYWENILETLQIKTPDNSMNILINSWLVYQTISCRIWGRSAFYQSGGAYGFRDQLQDVMNMIYLLPEQTRNQILLHCRHQYVEGDVQHWWHPGGTKDEIDKGIRTKFSDDLLWLPYVVAEYITVTEDYSILDEVVSYIESDQLGENEMERYEITSISKEKTTVYIHCIRAIERSLSFGVHGIPLIGGGDWNDGMNKVGSNGKGESIWLGWFLCDILNKFSRICKMKKDHYRQAKFEKVSKEVANAIEKTAWDGQWYRRAYFDDGTPLGSAQNSECIIDSISQSWAVISKMAKEDRKKIAMSSVENYLIREEEGIILLLTPPFNKSNMEPGYIKSYVPGVRENGGQYTHAAAWVVNAFAMMGDGDKAYKLYRLLNPINHTRTKQECNIYKVEPYVMAADVYDIEPHRGRGGWTWYTGAAGWMYKVGIESILGFRKEGNRLIINPCIPRNWKGYSIRYRYKNTVYNIIVKNPYEVNRKVKHILVDGKIIKEKQIKLFDDGKEHNIDVTLGENAAKGL